MRMVRLAVLPLLLATAVAATASAQPQPPRPLPPGPAAPLPPAPPGQPLPPGAVLRPAPPLGYTLRIRDYEARMKLKKLTAIEMKEYETLKAEQARYNREFLEAEKKAEETRAIRRAEAERAALAAYPNFAAFPPARAEFSVHSYRFALLERLRSVAVAEGRSDLFARIDGLIARENARHEAWVLAHRGGR